MYNLILTKYLKTHNSPITIKNKIIAYIKIMIDEPLLFPIRFIFDFSNVSTIK